MLHAPLESTDLADIQQSFADAYPRIEGLASAQHCRLRGERKEEAVAETVAIAWSEYRKLALAGRDVVKLLGRIIEFAAMRVRCGRGLTNPEPIRDVMSSRTRFRHRYSIASMPLSDREDANPEILDAMRGEGSPADQAVVNVDFEEWLETLDDRRREIAEKLASGLNTVDVGRQRGVTRAAIHWVRKDLIASWDEFHAGDGAC